MIILRDCQNCPHSDLRSYGIRVCNLRNEAVHDDDNCLIRETKLRSWYGRIDRLNCYEFPENKILEDGKL